MANKTEEETIKEAQTFVIAGLSLSRPISIDDVRWAVEKGFEKGKLFAFTVDNMKVIFTEKDIPMLQDALSSLKLQVRLSKKENAVEKEGEQNE